jgi:hypothetical protein
MRPDGPSARPRYFSSSVSERGAFRAASTTHVSERLGTPAREQARACPIHEECSSPLGRDFRHRGLTDSTRRCHRRLLLRGRQYGANRRQIRRNCNGYTLAIVQNSQPWRNPGEAFRRIPDPATGNTPARRHDGGQRLKIREGGTTTGKGGERHDGDEQRQSESAWTHWRLTACVSGAPFLQRRQSRTAIATTRPLRRQALERRPYRVSCVPFGSIPTSGSSFYGTDPTIPASAAVSI